MEILAARMSVADTVGDAAGSRRSTLASCVAVRRYLSRHTPAVSRARDAAGAPHGGSCDARLLALRGQDCPHLAQPQGRRRLGRSLAGDVLVVLAELVEGAALCRRLERLRSERRRVERAVLGGAVVLDGGLNSGGHPPAESHAHWNSCAALAMVVATHRVVETALTPPHSPG